jgi:hypothetical protein
LLTITSISLRFGGQITVSVTIYLTLLISVSEKKKDIAGSRKEVGSITGFFHQGCHSGKKRKINESGYLV